MVLVLGFAFVPDEWVPHRLVGVVVADDPRDPGVRRVRPILDRQPARVWCLAFDDLCDHHPNLDWKATGDVRCRPAAEADVHELLTEMVERANTFVERHPAPGDLDPCAISVEGLPTEDDDPGGYLYRQ